MVTTHMLSPGSWIWRLLNNSPRGDEHTYSTFIYPRTHLLPNHHLPTWEFGGACIWTIQVIGKRKNKLCFLQNLWDGVLLVHVHNKTMLWTQVFWIRNAAKQLLPSGVPCGIWLFILTRTADFFSEKPYRFCSKWKGMNEHRGNWPGASGKSHRWCDIYREGVASSWRLRDKHPKPPTLLWLIALI